MKKPDANPYFCKISKDPSIAERAGIQPFWGFFRLFQTQPLGQGLRLADREAAGDHVRPKVVVSGKNACTHRWAQSYFAGLTIRLTSLFLTRIVFTTDMPSTAFFTLSSSIAAATTVS